MKISFVEIQNFRKLKSCRIEFGKTETLLVGANNSGKTSAMQALIKFLGCNSSSSVAVNFKLEDFTASNWKIIDEIGNAWARIDPAENTVDLEKAKWNSILPALDIWLTVEANELQFVSEFIPTLGWLGGNLGIRLILEPIKKEKGLENLYKDFKESFITAKSVQASAKKKALKLWPETLCHFLNGKKESQLLAYFKIAVYILDPCKLQSPDKINNIAMPQETPQNREALDRNNLDSLFHVDIIEAQRGFSDGIQHGSQLSSQLRDYYDKHLDLEDMPDPSDVEALTSMQKAQHIFDSKLHDSFKDPLEELAQLGYPGLDNPKPTINTKITPQDGLSHNSAVEHSLCDDDGMKLPESYNGLGYQNLISMAFKMMSFRDEWMRKGKMGERPGNMKKPIPRLHLVLIEEPEAHLHTQVQQVFIKKAYMTLMNHALLRNKIDFSTQLIISTHSSHIVSGADFTNLRYFHRLPAKNKNEVPISAVVTMTDTFGESIVKKKLTEEEQTKRFATRYIRATHCDLFFADAVILVEGSAERMLLPHFIKRKYKVLDSSYISILEVGGSHAHRLKPLIEKLGIPCLIITDLDSGAAEGRHKAVRPERGKGYVSNNNTLKKWIPATSKLDELLDKAEADKIQKNAATNQEFIRVAYQIATQIKINDKNEEYIPYTFEDAFVCKNMGLFKSASDDGAIKEFHETVMASSSTNDLAEKMFDIIKGTLTSSGGRSEGLNKGEFILDIVYSNFFDSLEVPTYIEEGLKWLEDIMRIRRDGNVVLTTEAKSTSAKKSAHSKNLPLAKIEAQRQPLKVAIVRRSNEQ
jgi:predicted ATP-dependent endonuclease of OLD family